jgi:hypothetical protein
VTINRTSTIARARAIGLRIAIGSAAAAATLTLAAGPAAASTPPAFDNIPTTLPGNVASVGFEATQTSEFGDYIVLGGTERARAALPVTVVMSSWACQSDAGGGPVCTTTPGATFAQPLTLTIYGVDHSGSVPAAGLALLHVDHTFNIPYRPSYDPNDTCPSHQWRNAADGKCYSGIAHEVTFTLPSGANLPNELIWSISYNTGSNGYHPTGDQTKPYNSLNVSAQTEGAPSFGSEGEADGVFINSLNSDQYGPGGVVGTFSDTTGWSANKPLSCFGVTCPTSEPAATATPFQTVGGATGRPLRTPPTTSTATTSGNNPDPTLVLLICNAFGLAALVAVAMRRRTIRRRAARG